MRTRWNSVVTAALVVGVLAAGVTPAAAKGEEPQADQRVLRRETDDGVTIRVATGPLPEDWGANSCADPGCMPEPCQPRGIAILGFSSAAAVGEGYLEVYTLSKAPATFAGAGTFGSNVGAPVGWVAVRTGPKTARVRARFADGGSDAMRPVDGWAVLAAPIDDGPEELGGQPTVEVVAEGEDGAVLKTFAIDAQTPYPSAPTPCPTSVLESSFPKGSGRVPDDEAKATTEIAAAFSAAYGAEVPGAGLVHVEGGAELAEVTRVSAERYPQYAGKVRMTIDRTEFLDVDEAAVRMSVDLLDPGVPTSILQGIGRAVLRDGTWLVSRDTYCTVLAVGGVYCPLREGAKTKEGTG